MIGLNLADEFYIFLMAINYGLIIGVIYDLYRTFRYYTKPKKGLSFIEDLVLWLIITFIFFAFLVKNTDGVIRGFVLLGFVLGSIIYIKIISRYNFPILIKIFKLIYNIINEIIRLIVYPFKYISNLFKPGVSKCFNLFSFVFKDIKKYSKIMSKKK